MSCTHDSLKFLGAKWNLLKVTVYSLLMNYSYETVFAIGKTFSLGSIAAKFCL